MSVARSRGLALSDTQSKLLFQHNLPSALDVKVEAVNETRVNGGSEKTVNTEHLMLTTDQATIMQAFTSVAKVPRNLKCACTESLGAGAQSLHAGDLLAADPGGLLTCNACAIHRPRVILCGQVCLAVGAPGLG